MALLFRINLSEIEPKYSFSFPPFDWIDSLTCFGKPLLRKKFLQPGSVTAEYGGIPKLREGCVRLISSLANLLSGIPSRINLLSVSSNLSKK